MQQKEYIGFDSINNLKRILSKHNPRNIFLVTGEASYSISGAQKAIEPYLIGYNVTPFSGFEVNPKLYDIERGIMRFKENNCDFVIAIGGGSVMDVAKSVNIFVSNTGKPLDYIKKIGKMKNKGKTLVAIPTTSGSGSEATKFAVVYTEKIKQSLEHEFMLPDYAIVDLQFTLNLPKYITACSGIDALSQAIESYWCVNSTDDSKRYAKEAISLVISNLAAAVNDPSKECRGAMAKAAHLAGKAINISKTTACHAISYPITSYFNVPHGHAVSLTLAQILVYNSQVTEGDVLDKRGVNYVKEIINEIINLLGLDTVEEAAKKIENLMIEIRLSTKLSQLGIKTEDDIQAIIQRGFNPDRVKNNPRELTEEVLRKILHNIR